MRAKAQFAFVIFASLFLAGCATTEAGQPAVLKMAGLQAEGPQEPSEATASEAVAPEPASMPVIEQSMDDELDGEKRSVFTPYLALQQEDSDTALAVGMSYEYRLKQGIGLGAFAEYAGGEIDAAVIAGAFYLRPVQELRLLVGLGNDRRNSNNEFLVRVGGGYAFPLEGDLVLEPGVYIDFVDGDQKLMLAVGLGISF